MLDTRPQDHPKLGLNNPEKQRDAGILALFDGGDGLNDTIRFIEKLGGTGLWRWDILTDEMEWSPGLCSLLDVDPESVKPSFRRLSSMMHPDDRAAKAEIEALAFRGLPIDRQFRVILRNGRLRWLEKKGEVLFDKDGRPSKAVGILIDVTARQEVLQSIRPNTNRFHALRAAISGLVIIAKADGTVVDASDWSFAAEADEDAQETHWLGILHADDRPLAQRAWDSSLEDGSSFEIDGRMSSNGNGPVSARGVPIVGANGEVHEWIITFLETLDRSFDQGSPDADESLSGAQVRAARAVLNWSVRDLARQSNVSISVIRRIEEFDGIADSGQEKIGAIKAALEKAGVDFIYPRTGKPGVRPR